MNFVFRTGDFRRFVDEARRATKRDLQTAALIATDRASINGRDELRQKIRGVGLGKLGNAVGQTSAWKKRQRDRQPYGVIFARGGDDSRAGGALEAYSRGTTIRARNGKWLAFPTSAVPRNVVLDRRRRRLTAGGFGKSGLVTSIGRLEFRPVSPKLALLVIRNVTLSPKTGRAKAATGRRTRTRVPVKEVVAFVLIRVTRRAQRFDKDVIMARNSRRVPKLLEEALKEISRD